MSVGSIKQFITECGQRRRLHQEGRLFHQGDPVRSIYIVKAGLIELIRHQKDGTSIILQRASTGMIIAEASMYSENYHCDGVAGKALEVMELPKTTFLQRLHGDEVFSNAWSAYLAKEVQSARLRSEILSLKTVAERLDAWLAWQEDRLPKKGSWKTVASQIGVSPEALYRELARRRGR